MLILAIKNSIKKKKIETILLMLTNWKIINYIINIYYYLEVMLKMKIF